MPAQGSRLNRSASTLSKTLPSEIRRRSMPARRMIGQLPAKSHKMAAQKTTYPPADGGPAEIDHGTGMDHDMKIFVVPIKFIKKSIIAKKNRTGG